ncbi:hypothetical protein Tco_0547454 [Tanacetum coccineum]
MPKSIHVNHQDTAFYILKYHQTASLNSDERAIFKILERRFFNEGRVIHPSFLEDSSIRQIFSAINFDCLLDIDVKIYLVFVLEFYKTVQILQNVDEAISIAIIIRNFKITLRLYQFAQILRVPCEGVCMFSPDWYISYLPNFIDPDPIYLTPLDNPDVVHDAIFNERPPTTRRTVKGKSVVLDPYQMVLFEMNPAFRKWETILCENTICLSRNNDHPNACLVHVLTIQPYHTTDIHYLMDHVMVPLTGGGAQRFLVDGKGPHPKTSFGSSSSPSQTPTQEQVDLVDNYTLDPIEYHDQIPSIPGGASMEFKQTKGMFK